MINSIRCTECVRDVYVLLHSAAESWFPNRRSCATPVLPALVQTKKSYLVCTYVVHSDNQ